MKKNEVYDLESVLEDGRLTADPDSSENKPFKAYQALNMVKALGRPLTDAEMASLTDDGTQPHYRNVHLSEALVEA